MNHYTFSASVASVLSLLVCALALWRCPTSRLQRVFSVYWFSIAFWAFFVGWQSILIQKLSGFWWGWFLHLGCVFIPTLFLHFAFEYAAEAKGKRVVLGFAYGVSIAYLLLNISTTLFTVETAHRDAYAYPRPALLYPAYFITFVASIIYGTLLLFHAKRKMDDSEKAVLQTYLVGHVLGYTGGMDNFLIMADIRIFPLYPYGAYLIALYAATALYVLQKRGFLGAVATHACSQAVPSTNRAP